MTDSVEELTKFASKHTNIKSVSESGGYGYRAVVVVIESEVQSTLSELENFVNDIDSLTQKSVNKNNTDNFEVIFKYTV